MKKSILCFSFLIILSSFIVFAHSENQDEETSMITTEEIIKDSTVKVLYVVSIFLVVIILYTIWKGEEDRCNKPCSGRYNIIRNWDKSPCRFKVDRIL